MKVVDLFCGAGGFSRGFADEGFRILAGFDFEPAALRVYEANFPGLPKPMGLRPLSSRTTPRPLVARQRHADLGDLVDWAPAIAEMAPDVVIGGPPCQAFSKAGSRGGDDDRRAGMTVAFAILTANVRPRYVVMENVLEVRNSAAYRDARLLLKRTGYGLSEVEIDASRYGVAQNRKRSMLVGALNEADDWMLGYLDSEPVHDRMTVATTLGDDFGMPTADGRDRLYFRYPGGKSSAGTRSVHAPAPTITSKALDRPGPNYRVRKTDVPHVRDLPVLSFEQLAILAGFPRDWRWCPEGDAPLTKTAGALMVANAVAPPVAALLARCIRRHASGEEVSGNPDIAADYETWLRETCLLSEAKARRRVAATENALRLLGTRKILNLENAKRSFRRSKSFLAFSAEEQDHLIVAMESWLVYNDLDFPYVEDAPDDDPVAAARTQRLFARLGKVA